MVACLVVGSCAHGGFSDVDMSKLPNAGRYPGEDGVVLFDHRTLQLRAGDDGAPLVEETRHVRRRVFTEAGRKRLPLQIFTRRTFEELVELEARVISPSGEERRLTREDAIDAPALSGNALYNESRTVTLPFQDVPLGSVVDYRYKTVQREPRIFLLGHVFDDLFPVMESRLEVRLPSGWAVEHGAWVLDREVTLAPDVIDDDDGGQRLTFSRRDVPALKVEPYATQRQFPGTMVLVRLARWTEEGEVVSALSDDRALSRWMFERTDERAATTAEVRALAREILKGAPDDDREKIKRLYGWTRDHITYCAIVVGFGGWFPHPSRETERLRYGDCKDKANLLRALLKSEGIESQLASIFAHDGLPKPFRFPNLGSNTNHMILVVDLPEGRVAMDPTTRTVPFGRLPFSDQGAELLPYSKEGSPRWRTPVDEPSANVIDLKLDLVLKRDEEMTGTFDMVLEGEPADQLRYELLRTTESGVEEAVDRWVPVATDGVSDVVLENQEPPLDPTPLTVRGKLDGRGKSAQGNSRVLFRLNDYLFDAAPSLPPGPRRGPVLLGPPSIKRDVVTIRLPKGTEVGAVPPPLTLDSAYGRYAYDATLLEDGALRYTRSFLRKKSVVPPEEYAALRAFFDEVARAEARTVVLRFHDRGGAP